MRNVIILGDVVGSVIIGGELMKTFDARINDAKDFGDSLKSLPMSVPTKRELLHSYAQACRENNGLSDDEQLQIEAEALSAAAVPFE